MSRDYDHRRTTGPLYIALIRTAKKTSLPVLRVLSFPAQTCSQNCSLATSLLLSVHTTVTVVVVRSERLVAEAGDSSGTQRKGNVRL
jgi:hypothetical protein